MNATSKRRQSGARSTIGLMTVALALSVGASAAHATAVRDAKGDILFNSFDPKGAKTTDNFADLDVVKASATFDDKNVYLQATMAGAIGSTDTGFYVWGVNTGTGIPFFQQQPDHPEVGSGIDFDTFIVLNTNGTGSVNYFSGEPSEGIGSITITGNTIRAVISRDALEDGATTDIANFGFNIWPRANGFANTDVTDFAPDHQNFNASEAVPEPSTWALLIAGFGLVGSAVRRRRVLLA